VCWGDDEHGQASPPASLQALKVCVCVPVCVCALAYDIPRLHYGLLTLYVMGAQVSAGALHTCVVARNWSVVCFGSNAYRQASPPRGAGFVAVSAGLTFSCALRRM